MARRKRFQPARQLADHYQVTASTIHAWAKRFGVPRRRAPMSRKLYYDARALRLALRPRPVEESGVPHAP
jgi:DNA-binding transcriptional MerR regulator